MKKGHQYILRVFVMLALLAISAMIILKVNNYSFVYVGLLWMGILAILIWKGQSERQRLIAIYAGSIVIACTMAECYFIGLSTAEGQPWSREFKVIRGGYNQTHGLLGFAPVPGSKWSIKVNYGNTAQFDIIQTIDQNGLRLTPGEVEENAASFLFLGCSFTFGSDLNDDETLPYYFQSESSQQYKAVNMGYNGYGAHQVLSILEAGLEKEALSERKPKAGIYTIITDHVFRGTGRLGESNGGKYVLNEERRPEKKGNFSSTLPKVLNPLRKSHLLRRFLEQRTAAKEEEIDLVVSMIAESARLFEKRYGVPMYCLLWDELRSEEGLYERMLIKLKKLDIELIEVKEILPNYDQHPERYALFHDGHPNALANRLIAEYISMLITP